MSVMQANFTNAGATHEQQDEEMQDGSVLDAQGVHANDGDDIGHPSVVRTPVVN